MKIVQFTIADIQVRVGDAEFITKKLPKSEAFDWEEGFRV
jgi:hypothetical protein